MHLDLAVTIFPMHAILFSVAMGVLWYGFDLYFNFQMGELPHDVDWSFVFRIDPDGNVSRVSSTSQQKRFHQMQPIPDSLFQGLYRKCIILVSIQPFV